MYIQTDVSATVIHEGAPCCRELWFHSPSTYSTGAPFHNASLLAFMAGALFGGMINVRHSNWTQMRLLKRAIEIEALLLLIATSFAATAGTKTEISPGLTDGLIILLALAMGVRNAVVRKLAVPDLTTTVLTLTVTGIGSDSSLAGGANPRWRTRVTAVITMFAGAATGAMFLRYGVFAPLGANSLLLLAVLVWMAVMGPDDALQGRERV
jgi:uncharacterized membrane protein YoaK (UPF0700 family)